MSQSSEKLKHLLQKLSIDQMKLSSVEDWLLTLRHNEYVYPENFAIDNQLDVMTANMALLCLTSVGYLNVCTVPVLGDDFFEELACVGFELPSEEVLRDEPDLAEVDLTEILAVTAYIKNENL